MYIPFVPSPRAPVRYTIVASATLLAIVACDQMPTAPAVERPSISAPSQSVRWSSAGGEDNSPLGGAGPVLAAAATHDGSQPQATIPGFFKYHTIVSVTAQGTIHRETVFGPFGYPDYGPLGTGAAPGDGAVWIKQTTSNDPAVAIPAESFTADFQNTVAYGRNGSAALPSNTNPSCGNKYIANDPDCLAFSSVEGTRLSYTAYEVTLNGTSDANSVASNTLVRFDISPSQTSINGFSVHTDASEWQWTPDDPQYGGSVPIACNGGLHCELFVVHSGRMSARAYTNGRMHFLRGPGSPN